MTSYYGDDEAAIPNVPHRSQSAPRRFIPPRAPARSRPGRGFGYPTYQSRSLDQGDDDDDGWGRQGDSSPHPKTRAGPPPEAEDEGSDDPYYDKYIHRSQDRLREAMSAHSAHEDSLRRRYRVGPSGPEPLQRPYSALGYFAPDPALTDLGLGRTRMKSIAPSIRSELASEGIMMTHAPKDRRETRRDRYSDTNLAIPSPPVSETVGLGGLDHAPDLIYTAGSSSSGSDRESGSSSPWPGSERERGEKRASKTDVAAKPPRHKPPKLEPPEWREPKWVLPDGSVTELLSIRSAEVQMDRAGRERVVLVCPNRPQAPGLSEAEENTRVQMKWLHVQSPDPQLQVLSRLVLDCPSISLGLRSAALSLLDTTLQAKDGQKDSGVAVRNQKAEEGRDEQVLFMSILHLDLFAKNPHVHGAATGTKSLLEFLYSDDVGHDRESKQVVRKMKVGSSSDLLHVSPLWCLLLGSKILVTFSHLARSEVCGDLIEVDTRGARGFYTVSVEYRPGLQHNIVIEPDCSYVDFLRQAVALCTGGASGSINYDLIMTNETEPITASRWLQLLSSELIERQTLRLVPKNSISSSAPSFYGSMPYSRPTSEYIRSRNASRRSSLRMRRSQGGDSQYMRHPFPSFNSFASANPFAPSGRANSGYSDYTPYGYSARAPPPPPSPSPPPPPEETSSSRPSPTVRRGRRRASSSSGSYTGQGVPSFPWTHGSHSEDDPGQRPSRTSIGPLTDMSASTYIGSGPAPEHTYGQLAHEKLLEASPGMQHSRWEARIQPGTGETPGLQMTPLGNRALPRGPLFARFPAPPFLNEDDGIRVYPLPPPAKTVVKDAPHASASTAVVSRGGEPPRIRGHVELASPYPASDRETVFEGTVGDSPTSKESHAALGSDDGEPWGPSTRKIPEQVQIHQEPESYDDPGKVSQTSHPPSLETSNPQTLPSIAPAPAPRRRQALDADESFQQARPRGSPGQGSGRNPRQAFVESDPSLDPSDSASYDQETRPSQTRQRPAFAPADLGVEDVHGPVFYGTAPRHVRFESRDSVHERSPSPRRATRPPTPEQYSLETLGIQILPFFCWRLKSSKDHETPEETDKALFRVLGKINRSLQRDESRKLYNRAHKCTMQEVLQRYAGVMTQHKAAAPAPEASDTAGSSNKGGSEDGLSQAASLEPSTILTESEPNSKAGAQGPRDIATSFSGSSTRDKGKGRLSSIVPAFGGELLGAWKLPVRGGSDTRTLPYTAISTNTRTSVASDEAEQGTTADSGMDQTGVDGKTLALINTLVEKSQALLWAFLPKEGSSQIHQVCGRFWGAVDEIIRHLLLSSPNDLLPGQKWVIREFHHASAGTNGKKQFADCSSCKNGEKYSQAWDAIKHLHDQHIDCSRASDPQDQPSDDPCFAWVQSTRRGISLENFVAREVGILTDELTRFTKAINEVHSLVAHCRRPEDSTPHRPSLPSTLVYAFEELVVSYIVLSRYLSLVLKSRTRGEESFDHNERKMQALKRREMQAVFAVHEMLDWAKKDVILSSSISPDVDALGINAVGAEFLVAALATAAQDRPLEPKSKTGPIDLYREYMSKLRYQANRRAQRRIFLDVHNLEEELEALRGLVNKQRDQLEWYLASIDPVNSRFDELHRSESYQVEKDYVAVQIRKLRRRVGDISRLQDRCKSLKDQVKQTLEIIEEDHGKAIRVFTIVTLFFLPLSFVTGFMGMNTNDIRNMQNDQVLFWSVAVPVTAFVLSLAFLYAYKSDSIGDWVASVLRPHRRPPPVRKPKHGPAPKMDSDALIMDKFVEGEGDKVPFWRQYGGRRKNKSALVRQPTNDSDFS